jgi:hypothetical protein
LVEVDAHDLFMQRAYGIQPESFRGQLDSDPERELIVDTHDLFMQRAYRIQPESFLEQLDLDPERELIAE